MFESRKIDLHVLQSTFDSVLITRTTLTIFLKIGNMTFKWDLSINSDNGSDIISLASLRILLGMLLRAEDLLTCGSWIDFFWCCWWSKGSVNVGIFEVAGKMFFVLEKIYFWITLLNFDRKLLIFFFQKLLKFLAMPWGSNIVLPSTGKRKCFKRKCFTFFLEYIIVLIPLHKGREAFYFLKKTFYSKLPL